MSASPLVCLLFLLSVGRPLSDIVKTESITPHSINRIWN